MANNQDKFQSIRSYKDEEVNTIINELLDEGQFSKILSFAYPENQITEIREHLRSIKTINDFQKDVVYFFVSKIKNRIISNLSFSGLQHLDPRKTYLFMSNHRDIILDSALLNILLHENGFTTTENAIGSNLLLLPWIEKIVRLNKSFIVKRNLPVREMLQASRELSEYIYHSLHEKKNSVWIAQKEGRTKDGNDKTHPGLLKMLTIAYDTSIIRSFKKMNIVPVSISYEIEPLVRNKTIELYTKFETGEYKKAPKEDLLSMQGGLNTYKGRVHISFGKPIKRKLLKLKRIHNRNEQFAKLAQIIDSQIYKNYKLFPGNYAAYDILFKTDYFKDRYTDLEFEEFKNHMNKEIEQIKGNKKIIKMIFLGIYANPVINKYTLRQKPISFV
jgi:glycerol-3-phosphate O-acyltransferase